MTPPPRLRRTATKGDHSTSSGPAGRVDRARYSAPQRRERLTPQDVDAGQSRRPRRASRERRVAARTSSHGACHGTSIAQRLMAQLRTTPAAGANHARDGAEHAVLEQQQAADQPRAGAERLQDGGLVACGGSCVIATAPVRISTPVNSTSPPTIDHAEREAADQRAAGVEQLAQVDHRHVRERAPPGRAAVARARPRSAGPRNGAMKPCGALVERSGPEHEHEAAGARVTPVDRAHAGDFRLDRLSEDVEADGVAHLNLEAVAQALLDRDLRRRRRRRVPERPATTRSFALQRGTIGDRVFAGERAAARGRPRASRARSRARSPR